MEELSKDYLKGFNHGYDLQKHDHEVLDEILKIPQVDNEYFEGLKDGKPEYEKAQTKGIDKNINTWEKERLRTLYPNKPIKDKDRDKEAE